MGVTEGQEEVLWDCINFCSLLGLQNFAFIVFPFFGAGGGGGVGGGASQEGFINW